MPMDIKKWLNELKVGDRIRVGHPRMCENEFVFTKIKEALRDRVAIHTSCGMTRWFSRDTGIEIGKPSHLAGSIRPPGVS